MNKILDLLFKEEYKNSDGGYDLDWNKIIVMNVLLVIFTGTLGVVGWISPDWFAICFIGIFVTLLIRKGWGDWN